MYYFCLVEQLEHFKKHMEAGEMNLSTSISEDENEEDATSGGKELVLQLFKRTAHKVII